MKTTAFVSYEQGEKIRKARRKQKITQEDLALSLDISPSLVSKNERGAYQVAEDNLVAICDFLGLEVEEFLEMKKEDRDNKVDTRLLLKIIEHDIHLVGVNEVWKELNNIQLEPDDPLLGEYYFLLGQIYETKQNWCKAQEFYEKAIFYIENISILNISNIISGCYYGLGRILGKQSKLIQAIAILKKGEKYFIDGAERSYLKYNIMLSQAIFLEKLNQNEEAFRITDELKDCKSLVASTEAKTNLAQLQATLLNKFGFYEQSIRISEEGMILARLDKLYDRTFELWTTRGESYRKKKEFSNAKQCLKTALKLKQKIRYVPLTISTYTQLGLLYLELNNNQKAKATLEQAVDIGKKTKDKPRLMNALIALGDCYLQKEQFTQAKKQYEEALLIAKNHHYTQHEWDILMKLAETCKKDNLNDFRKYVEQFHQLSLDLRKGGAKSMSFNHSLGTSRHLEAEPPDM